MLLPHFVKIFRMKHALHFFRPGFHYRFAAEYQDNTEINGIIDSRLMPTMICHLALFHAILANLLRKRIIIASADKPGLRLCYHSLRQPL